MGKGIADASPAPSPESARPLASVIVLTKNAGPRFDEVMAAASRQVTGFPYEIIVVDSGSTDGTTDAARRHGARVFEIEPAEFHHAATRNLGACLARGEYLVYLTQDAEPADDVWLESLVRAVADDSRVAGAYSRVLPPRDADPLTEASVLADINARAERIVQERGDVSEYASLGAYRRRLLCNFNDVSSCLRRSVWRVLPYPHVPFGEDLLWAKSAIEAGHRIVFEPRSAVLHGHRYGLRDLWRRTVIDGWSNRAFLDRRAVESLGDVFRGAAALAARDWKTLAGRASWGERLRVPFYRFVEMAGLYSGGRRGRPRRTPLPSPDRPLRVLLALHGFPPATFAGTEVYTLNLARELRKRGHAVAIFHRVEDRSLPNYSMAEGEYDGFPVFRVVNNLDYAGIEETVQNVAIEEKFRWTLARFSPDVVHFQHCLHTSAGLLSEARRAGVPVVLTLHDYWFICPKVQLIRSDGSVCTYERPGVRCVRCAENRTWKVRAAKSLALLAAPIVPWILRPYQAAARRFPRLRRRILLDVGALSRRRRTIIAALSGANVLVSPSRFLRERYVRFGVDPGKILFIRAGIRTGALRAVRRRPAGGLLRTAFIGSLVSYKGPEVLVSAARRVEDARLRLSIHGDDASAPSFRALKEKLVGIAGGDERIAFRGPFRNDDLPRLYEEIDVLVVPSLWYENAPLVISEALAARVPVVASRIGALPDFVHHERNGLLFEPGDADDLARCFRRLLSEKGLLERLRDGIVPPKDVDLHAAEIETIYRQVLGESDAARGLATPESAPCAEVRAHRFESHRGTVQIQGGEFALLRPHDGTWSSVQYRLDVPRDGRYRLALETRVLDGEHGVELGGEVLIDERSVSRISLHAFGDGAGGLVRRFDFELDLLGGAHRLEVTNRPEGSRRTHLRLQRLLLFSVSSGSEPR